MEADGTQIPRSGWQVPGADTPRREAPTPEAIAELFEKLLEMLPEDLQERLKAALHDLLEAIRALIDWWMARLGHRASDPVQVRDIPIL